MGISSYPLRTCGLIQIVLLGKLKARKDERLFEMESSHATKRYTDISTSDDFQFVFHCDRCNAGALSEKYVFNTTEFNKPLNEKARALLWTRQHTNAYKRASGEAQYEFNVCPQCGRRVCTECFHLFLETTEGACADCEQKRK